MFFITFIALYLIANGWIFYSAWPLIRPLPPILKIAATVLFAAVVLLFPSLMFFRDELGSGRFGNFLYSASSVWLAITLYLTLLLIAAALLRLLGIIVPHSFGICCARCKESENRTCGRHCCKRRTPAIENCSRKRYPPRSRHCKKET